MHRPAILQDSWTSETDPAAVCSFDYEAIQAPTRPLLHQAARFLYIKQGRGTIDIDGVSYALAPDTLVAITPWKISEITGVSETLRFTKVVYDYHYLSFFLKGNQGSAGKDDGLLNFLSMEPVGYLTAEQAAYIDTVMEQLRAELGVESTRLQPRDKPMTQLYVTNKLVELIIMYRRCVLSARAGKDAEERAAAGDGVLSYLYAHSSEKLTVDRVADAFFMSRSTLAKQLAEKTGSSFVRLLAGIRVEKAADYLIYTDLRLEEIAALTGFTDASHLSKRFVSQMGITPMQYRKSCRGAHTRYRRTDKDVAFAVMNCVFRRYREEGLSAGRVAAGFGISVREMNRLLLYYAEKNFETLLNHVRIQHACELLSSTALPVIDVAVAVGYRSVRTFNVNFLKYKGMTPSQFRSRVALQRADGSETGGPGD